jgi:hypothetical protein
MEMHFLRVLLAAVGAFVVYFIIGTIGFVALPSMKKEFEKYPAVYRGHEAIMKVMPLGMLAMFVSMLVLAVLYALMYHGGSGFFWGLHFGLLIGVFVLCAFVIHNHVNLNIGWGVTIQSGIAYFVEWVAVGIVIGLIYQPS